MTLPLTGAAGFIGCDCLESPRRGDEVVRADKLDPNDDVDNNEREERGLVLGYFWNKHNHKLQADYREIETKPANTTDKEVRLQYQIIF